MRVAKRFGGIVAVVGLLASAGVFAAGAQVPIPTPTPTAISSPPPEGPCPYKGIDYFDDANEGRKPFENPPSQSAPHIQNLVLQYTDPAITKIAGCALSLRSYNGKLVGPTLRAKPGQSLEFTLENRLPTVDAATLEAQRNQQKSRAHLAIEPHNFNTTNIHFHGLRVNPYGTGSLEKNNYVAADNVLLAIPPGAAENPPVKNSIQKYKVDIPADHPSGTFWYHSHPHGSTAMQVGSGMSGTIIVEDDMEKLKADAPNLWAASQPSQEKIMVVQSILYDTHGKAENFGAFTGGGAVKNPDNPGQFLWCPQAVGNAKTQTKLDQCPWQQSGRRMTINGQLMPVITMKVDEVQRWRMVGSSFHEMVSLQLPKATLNAKTHKASLNYQDGIDLNEIALDGLYLPRVDRWSASAKATTPPPSANQCSAGSAVPLHSGYRSDVLVRPTKPGTYILVDCASPGATGMSGISEDVSHIAMVRVEGRQDPPMQLPTNAEMAKVSYRPGVDLRKNENIGTQQVQFMTPTTYAATTPQPPATSPSPTPLPTPIAEIPRPGTNKRFYYQVNGESFNPNQVRYLKLGTTDMWSISNASDPPGVATGPGGGPHLFHIHVNPFQTMRAGPGGKNEFVWKDTIVIPRNTPTQPANPVLLWTEYVAGNKPDETLGQFVIHCHILDHEDLGMMETVQLVKEIPLPETGVPPGGAHGGHDR